MNAKRLNLKKGGLDTIVAYIVVMLPLLYVLIYMVATIYHFSVQQYMNQVVKEATVMASTYGKITTDHEAYIRNKLSGVLEKDANGVADCTIQYYIRKFDEATGTVGPIQGPYNLNSLPDVNKADIIGIYVESAQQSILGSVTSFNVFSADSADTGLKYSSYREEIIRNYAQ